MESNLDLSLLVGSAAGRLHTSAPAMGRTLLGHAAREMLQLSMFEIPVKLPCFELSMAWHPRDDADGGHRWTHECVRDAVLRDG